MSDGFGCQCMARNESECCCGVDWRSEREVGLEQKCLELAAQNEGMREAIELYFKQYPHMMKGYILDAINSPNLATEILRKRDAATLRRAANVCYLRSNLVAAECGRAIEKLAAEIEKETT